MADQPRYIVERLNPDFGFFVRAGRTLQTAQTRHQRLEIVESEEFGKVLLLDGVTQVASRHEFIYHEPMVHPALAAHPRCEDVLIIGGGDGGILRQVLRYRSVRKAVLAELDEGVIAFSDKYLPEVNGGAFRDTRVRTEIGDGRAFVERTDEIFDAVIMDMTDPFGPSALLYTREFFRAVKARFRDEDGIFVMHTESPITRPRTFQQCLRTLADVFRYRRTMTVFIPMYAVLWSVTICSDSIDVAALTPAEIDARLKERGVTGLDCYTGATHQAMLTVMPFLRELIDDANAVSPITDAFPRFLDEIDLNSDGGLSITQASGDHPMPSTHAEPPDLR